MKIKKFRNWSFNATSRIGFPPDRKKVQQELYDHMADHYEELLLQGMDQDTAEAMTVEAMGDPMEIASLLGEIHRPFWGYLLRFLRVTLAALILLTVIPVAEFLWDIYAVPMWYIFNTDTGVCAADVEIESVQMLKAKDSFRSESAVYSLTEASLWSGTQTYSDGSSKERSFLAFRIEQVNLFPYGFDRTYYSTVLAPLGWMWAEDDLGNYYYSYMERSSDPDSGALYLQIHGSQTGLMTYSYEFWVNDFPENVQWLALHYDRDGRDYVMYIDLSGGDGT